MAQKYEENPLLVMCTRIHEPIFMPKGDRGQCKFSVPPDFWLEKYRSIMNDVENNTDNNYIIPNRAPNFRAEAVQNIRVNGLKKKMDLDEVLTMDRYENFSIFNRKHQDCAMSLCKQLMEAEDIHDFISRCAFCRDRVNCQMFIYCTYICMLHRNDCKHMPLPKLWETFPDKFIDVTIFNNAKETANILPDGKRAAIKIPPDWTATDEEPEHRLAYWREDIGINLHHWHWHLIYPPDGLLQFVDKPKRGELNYYMHHQVMARYNTERLCNGLGRVRPFDFQQPIAEAYFPKLTESSSGRNLPSRPANMKVSDITRPIDRSKFTVAEMQMYRNRILETIESMKVVLPNNETKNLDEKDGINILMNIIESCALSVNREYYGNFHNNGHNMIAHIHDPDYRHLEGASAMGESATAMRDPVFYRWHELIDELCTLFKDKLPPYTRNKLNFPGVTVTGLTIKTEYGNPNTLYTHFVESSIDLSRGLDFTEVGSVLVTIQHLDHTRFKYHITVRNDNTREVTATVRIFMAPRYDENGTLLTQNEQRMLMIEMDKSTHTLQRGMNELQIDSFKSSVTIPWETTFAKTDTNVPLIVDPNQPNYNADQECGCGWPLHMLVPKGLNNQGFPMDLFVMLSNYELDRIVISNKPNNANTCNQGVSYCGLKNQPWPEVQSMGYPFDRIARSGVQSMSDFLTPNMAIQPITIVFTGNKSQRESGQNSTPTRPPLVVPPFTSGPIEVSPQ